VSTRTYLSIGDVLTLLREEFPDVTISKIRFLESQGLVNPERSPSGYRKFFEHDVERLRWVLRQQREHFLPLKVIRDRLAAGDLDDSPLDVAEVTGVPSQSNGRASEPAHAGVVAGGGIGATVGLGRHSIGSPAPGAESDGAGVGATAGRVDEPMTKADSEAMARILADASRRTARMPEAPRDSAKAVGDKPSAATAPAPAAAGAAGTAVREASPLAAARGSGASPAGSASAVHASASSPAAGNVSAGRTSAGRQPGGADARGKGVDVVAEAVASASKGAATPPAAGHSRRTSDRPPSGAAGRAPAGSSSRGTSGDPAPATAPVSTSSMVTGASLTTDELCSASGLSEIELASLQGFGLIEAFVVAGIPTFDEDALTVANLAAELRIFGIEPRHLRLYKNAVDREVGLIEQVIIPLLRQRNPESRQRAIESAEQLATLGQTMRATLVRSALRRHMGG
jgi:DNA-binding transcriptional MerR regulator